MQSVLKENDQLKKDIEKLELSLKEADASIISLNSKTKESVHKDSEIEKKIAELNEQVDKLTKESISNKVIHSLQLNFCH